MKYFGKAQHKCFWTLILFMLLPIFIMNCSNENYLKNGTVTFTVGSIKINGKKTRVGERVYLNDVIKTGKNSIVTIQFSEVAVLTIRSKTTVKIEKLAIENGIEIINLFQKTGSTFNRVVKKGIHYNVQTPTIVAGIRGTSFDIKLSRKKSIIRLLKGKVKLTRIKKDKKKAESSIMLMEGHFITSTNNKISKPLKISKKERKELKLFNEINLITTEKIKEIEKNKLKKGLLIPEVISEKQKKQILKIEKKSQKRPVKRLTLKEIKKKYGALSIVETKNNKKYIGAFKQDGKKIEVITTKGKVKINSDNIKKISTYKF